MRTVTTETTIYSFNELPEDVQATVTDNWRILDRPAPVETLEPQEDLPFILGL